MQVEVLDDALLAVAAGQVTQLQQRRLVFHAWW